MTWVGVFFIALLLFLGGLFSYYDYWQNGVDDDDVS